MENSLISFTYFVEMENFSLMNLPEEMTEQILSFVERESRWEAASVCKPFYKAVCKLDQRKFKANVTFDQVRIRIK